MSKGLLQRLWMPGADAATGAHNLDLTASQSDHRRLLRLGVSAKLQAAFGAVAGLTVLAAAVAFISFSALESGLQRVVNHQMPVMTDAMRLSVISGNISAAAARFISAKTDEDRKATVALMEQKRADLTSGIVAAKQKIGESPALTKLIGLSQYLEANLTTLEEAISQRTQLREQIDDMLESLHQVRALIIEELARVSDPAQALEVSAHTHLLVSLISEGSIVRDPSAFKNIQDRLKVATSSLNQTMSKFDNESMKASLNVEKIRKGIEQLSRFSQGADSIFARRARELFTTTRVDAAIDENVSIQRELDSVVATLVNEAEVSTQAGTAELIDSLKISSRLLLIVVVTSLLAAGGIGVFYVQRQLVRRLIEIGTAMRRLSSGEIDIAIPSATEHDEIGDMADSLEVFRASEIERRSLSERERSEQKSQRERGSNIEKIIAEFRATVTNVIGSVAENVAPPGRLDVLANGVEACLHCRLDWPMPHFVSDRVPRREVRQPAPRRCLECLEHPLGFPAELLAHPNEVPGSPRGCGIERRALARRRRDRSLSHRSPFRPSLAATYRTAAPMAERDRRLRLSRGVRWCGCLRRGVRKQVRGRRWQETTTFPTIPPHRRPRSPAASRRGFPRY